MLSKDHFGKTTTTTTTATTTTAATTTYKFISPKMQNSPATTIHHPSPPPTPIIISDPNNPYPTTFSVRMIGTITGTTADMLSGETPPPAYANAFRISNVANRLLAHVSTELRSNSSQMPIDAAAN
ncbi:hypothetical protein QVD17_15509 [Tagetes erecta]|uniref:Uncharacterized protein n=1 Tax=Tagetes erecta TaxID=13708 RepID=A0AAD8NZQ9_TARER|nr:hypothetical protein QVD17_15509 [Tagetes erecta]